MKYAFISLLPYLLLPFSVNAATYIVNPEQSAIHFSGIHADEPFEGKFNDWQADITFDANHLDQSSFNVTIHTKSAKTGNMMYDGTLPQADWFAVSTHPTAQFVSQLISKTEDHYTVDGLLTIRGIEKPISFDFILDPTDGNADNVKATATLALDRMDYDIGKESDPNAEWVSREIPLKLSLVATKKAQ